MSYPEKCHPHYCAFDSPACPEQCESGCQRIKPKCVSITAQQAMNIPERKIGRNKAGIPLVGYSTRERVFGIPYDPRKDVDIEVPQKIIDTFVKENYDSLNDGILKKHIAETCCANECRCVMGSKCACKKNRNNCMRPSGNKKCFN
ncbi:uncharacterized protein LOC129222822 [Uloborus diversus]|uniref:uncharacterized protein LOC129222822 n=1 Tax=Uloborus diversus TaxID=327109 RepID=UPI002409FAEA|nr:uncharacterized protein LOC129222822 [Uloborus diversus]